MTTDLDQAVSAYGQQYAAAHPGLDRSAYDRAISEERRRLIATDPGVVALQKQGEQRAREKQAAEAAREAAIQQEAHDRGALRLAQTEAAARQRWAEQGGTEAQFDAAWPAMRSAILQERVTATETEAREALRRQARAAF